MAGNPRIDELRKKLDKEPGSRLFAQLAEELRKDGDLEDSIQVAREGLQKHPNYPSARMTLGRALFDTGDWAAARAEFELVLKGAPDNILASRLLAESLESLGDAPAAIARYKKTLALAPGDQQVMARLEALESGGAPGSAAAPAGAPAAPPPPAASPAPIRVVEVDTPMELEQTHERPAAFSAGPPPPAAAPPSAPTGAETQAHAGSSPAPIPVAEAEEDFELERPYEPPRPVAIPPVAAPPEARPAPAAPVARPAPESMMEFEFEAGPAGSTIPFAPPPAPAPAAPPEPPPPVVASPPAIAVPSPPVFTPPAVAAKTVEVPSLPPPRPVPTPPPAAPVPAPAPAAESASDELTSATLAELYFKQGFPEKAVEVYRQLVDREPQNDRLRRRLAELQDIRPAPSPAAEAAPVAAAASGPSPASRRVALERTIAKLEGMLAAIKKG